MPIHHLTHDTSIEATPTSEQTHRSHIEPIGAYSTKREEREREKSERDIDKEDRVEKVGESEQMREKGNKIIYIFFFIIVRQCNSTCKIAL